jgi:hypothetical protein
MITQLYTVRDRVAEESGPIFQAKNDGIAYRAYSELLQSATNSKPDDYMLLHLGSYDNETTTIKTTTVRQVYIGLTMVDELEEENV